MADLSSSKNILSKIFLGFFVFFVIFSVALPVFAWSPFQPVVPPCDGSITAENSDLNDTRTGQSGCGYNAFLQLVSNIIQFLLYIAIPIAAVSFFFAGFLYLTAGGNPGKIEEAHHIFWSALVGIIIMLAAWLIINTILTALVEKGSGFNLLG
ncbi:MAG: pilin [Candidatus Pacebacteria bacterium]|nr:pilin [Candidatus Paceibacterota bacterium]MDD5356702.1 pilin [Candidatus Paceibacterota bacterium]